MTDFERSGNNPSDFEIEDQSTLDLILLAEVATDFGDVQVASNWFATLFRYRRPN